MEKKENELLLEISKAISTIRRKEDLLQVILEKIKPQLGFYDSGILLLDKEKEHFFDLSVLHPEIDNSQINHSLHQGSYYQIIKMPLKGSTVEHTIRQLSKKRELVVFDFEADYSTYTDAKLMVDIKRQGIKEGLAALLQTGGEVLGVFFINSLQKDFFQPRQFSFFQVIAELVAVAVANILANEEILEREREKTMLLSLSEDMATIRDREDLWRVIVEKTRPLVNFNDAVIIQLSLDGHQYKHLLTASTLERKRTDLYQQLVGPFLPLKNTSVAYLLQLPDATVWHTEELLKCYPNDAGLHLCQQTGLHHGVVLHLIWAGQLIGLLQLAFNQQDQIQSSKLPFYKAIADQVAVAVANILANEEILRRESEKETLLTVSEDIATIRDKEDLFRIVTGKLQPLFGFQDAVISLLYPEQNQIVHLLTISPPERQAPSLYQKIVRQTQPLLGSGYEYTMSLPEGGQFKTKDLLEQYPQADGLKLMLETDLHYSAFIPLRNMGNRLGQLNLHYHQEPNALNFRLLRNLADQIAVGVANILANEEILQREREKSLQIILTDTLTRQTSWEQKLLKMVEALQPLVPFDYVAVGIEKNGKQSHGYSYRRIGLDEYQTIGMEDFLRMSGLTPEKYTKLRAELSYTAPLLLTGKVLTPTAAAQASTGCLPVCSVFNPT
jgi:GAF domain-containing protein